IKAREDQVVLPAAFDAYQSFWNSALKPGYSGTAIFTKQAPLACTMGFDIDEHDTEGRLITLEYPDFFLINVYTPNSQDELRRLPYRLIWDSAFRHHLNHLARTKPVIFCGDLNVAHNEIDLANPKANRRNAGFSDEERASFSELLGSGFIDTFRHLYPEKTQAYSWWSYRGGARQRNVGWRIDYFGISAQLIDRLREATILPHVQGSDHCPVSITLR
ncbi:MAG: exodeoxyribonuclease III, partial [Armatimonadetes bacterium]|nr:exodeoxyribonuclease III [Akkermansiaceae bacterium]